MSLKIIITAHSDNEQSDTFTQEYTDSPMLSKAIERAKENALDYYIWNVPEGVKWTKIDISIEIIR